LRSLGFEEGKRRLAAALVERSLNGSSYITCKQILQENLPQFIKDCIFELAHSQFKKQKPLNWNLSADFDINDPDVRTGYENLAIALIRSMKLERIEVEKCIHEAIALRFDLLLKPLECIDCYLFSARSAIEKKLLLQLLQGLGKDIPYIAVLLEKLQPANKEEITRAEFSFQLHQAKQVSYSLKKQEIVLQEFDMLVEICNIDQGFKKKGVEVTMLEEFLVSRGLDYTLSQVHKKGAQGKSHWLTEDLNDLFDFPLSMPVELNKRFFSPKIIYADDWLQPIQRQNIERQPPGPYPSIITFIDKKDLKNFVRKLFDEDESAFMSFIGKIDKLEKWREAKQVIDCELEKRLLDPYGKEAVKLGDLVFSKYFSNGKYA
jgi:hypothetical protein